MARRILPLGAPPAPSREGPRGKAPAVLGVLASRGLEPTEEPRKTLLGADAERLDRWIEQVAAVESVARLLA